MSRMISSTTGSEIIRFVVSAHNSEISHNSRENSRKRRFSRSGVWDQVREILRA